MGLNRIRVAWAGWPGQPAVSTLYIDDVTPDLTALRQFFFSTLGGYLSSAITLTFPTVGDVIDPLTGNIVNTWVGAGAASITGASSGNFSGASGACMTWRTAGLVAGHRVRGRTFLVPLLGGAYGPDGTLDTNFRAAALAAAATMIAAYGPKFVVYHRKGAVSAGAAFPVLSASMTDQAMVLRSRRA